MIDSVFDHDCDVFTRDVRVEVSNVETLEQLVLGAVGNSVLEPLRTFEEVVGLAVHHVGDFHAFRVVVEPVHAVSTQRAQENDRRLDVGQVAQRIDFLLRVADEDVFNVGIAHVVLAPCRNLRRVDESSRQEAAVVGFDVEADFLHGVHNFGHFVTREQTLRVEFTLVVALHDAPVINCVNSFDFRLIDVCCVDIVKRADAKRQNRRDCEDHRKKSCKLFHSFFLLFFWVRFFSGSALFTVAIIREPPGKVKRFGAPVTKVTHYSLFCTAARFRAVDFSGRT